MTIEDLKAAVVDASVGVKLFVLEADSERVDRLFNRLAADPPAIFFVPDLFYIECTNVLWKYVRRFDYPAENARQAILDLQSLALSSIPTVDLIDQAFELALAYDIGAYDACYAVLARRLDLPLVTADAALAQKLAESGIVLHLLQEL